MMIRPILASFVASVTACYGSAPPRPAPIPLPAPANDAELVVHSETTTAIENVNKEARSCPAHVTSEHPSCIVTRYVVREPVTRTASRMTYAGEPINYGQFRVMTDPLYSQKLAAFDELAKRCSRAKVPRYVGIGLVIAGVLMLSSAREIEDTVTTEPREQNVPLAWAGLGVLVGGTVSYALGYSHFGGRQCNEALSLHSDLDVSRYAAYDAVPGTATAREMQTLAEQFNARRRPSSAMQMR